MKIAISGKGGSGKTTIAGVMARILSQRGYKVLAIDADDNPNLGLTLGLPVEKLYDFNPIPTRLLVKEEEELRLILPPDEIVRKYAIECPYNIKLLIMAKIEKAGVGCACGSHATIRELVKHLTTKKGEAIIIDMEPGLEIMGRATPRYSDRLLIVVEPYYKSVQTAIKLFNLAKDLGMKKIYTVLNKVRNESEISLFESVLSRNDIPVIGKIPYDQDVVEADKLGKSIMDYNLNSKAVRAVEEIVSKLTMEDIGE
ncbi:carbon monoxide dehydrogenase accessory protein CooC [Saccharolobus solfataricus]|uniref:Cobyrinic acid ac-diamide synthase n=1 Tax=Saccharolobus solfataricus TaxID=2287 RepID=A0A157T1T5_SACSO|nr:carbon monoxide dehydrogenase accessory protein CooC [Saccharolobus solfataricus]SAI84858.1 cobyrinic acid ac-diamide synthase [Saccharolobus solfataricus]